MNINDIFPENTHPGQERKTRNNMKNETVAAFTTFGHQ